MKRGWRVVLVALIAATLGGCAGGPPPADSGGEAQAGTPARGGGLSLDPERACGLLADQGLRTVGGYHATVAGVSMCSSFEKQIPAGDPIFDTLKFFAQGTAEAVTQLTVELALKSRGDVQVAFRYLLQSVEALTDRALGAKVPDEAQLAIMSGVSGSWPVGGATLTVQRVTTFTISLVVTLR